MQMFAIVFQSVSHSSHITPMDNLLQLFPNGFSDINQNYTISTPELINIANNAIPDELPETGLGDNAALQLVIDKIAPGLALGQSGPRLVVRYDNIALCEMNNHSRYFGFVTGGVLPAAQVRVS